MIEAAGGVVWRLNDKGQVKVLIVHRPAYGDWTFPKGKVRRGERARDAARREVEEETGLACDLGPSLPDVHYVHRKGRDKRVRYWAMQVSGGRFQPNSEVDAIRWVRLDDARALLTYRHDRPLIPALREVLALVS